MNKKNLIFFTLFVVIVFLFSSCDSSKAKSEDERISVVATIFPQYDFARQIGGDRIKLKMLTTPGGESHSYEPTPQDIKAVSECDVFICAGGESDIWYNSVLKTIDTENITVISLMECVGDRLKEEEIINGMRGEKLSLTGGEEKEEIEYDEHVWTSIKNACLIAEEICGAISCIDKENADFYRENTELYTEKLRELDQKYQSAAEEAETKTVVFGDRFPFRYLFDDYGLKYYAAFPGCSTDSDVSANTMLFLIKKVTENELPSVYYIEFSARRIADTVADETGAQTLLLHSCHTVSKKEFEGGVTYMSLMEQNLENLKKGLNKKGGQ